jgi:hypothetical protein
MTMPVFATDEALWYNVGIWGQLGYGVPNFGDNGSTLNKNIAELVEAIGRNLSGVMHCRDTDMRVPPSINTLQRVHKLIIRARSILAGRAVPAGKPRMEGVHATPAREDFLIFPVPFFKVRNRWLKSWASLTLCALSEAMQHTDNHLDNDISEGFAGLVGQYLQRIYVRMATELLLVPRETAEKNDFTLTEQQFAAYDPSKFFTSTEMIDTTPPPHLVPTEDDLRLLTDGIPAGVLVGTQRYPRADGAPAIQLGSGPGPITGGTEASAASSTGSFIPPPSA